MAKSIKSIGMQYESTLHNLYKVSLADCTVLGFSFSSEEDQHGFHFAIIKRVPYRLYDGYGDKANVVMPHDADTHELIEIASNYGGARFTPSLL